MCPATLLALGWRGRILYYSNKSRSIYSRMGRLRSVPLLVCSITYFDRLSRLLLEVGCPERLPDIPPFIEREDAAFSRPIRKAADRRYGAGFPSGPPEVKFRSAYRSLVGKYGGAAKKAVASKESTAS